MPPAPEEFFDRRPTRGTAAIAVTIADALSARAGENPLGPLVVGFADGGALHLVHQLDAARQFVTGEAPAAVLDEFFQCRRRAGTRRDDGGHALAEAFVRKADDHRVVDVGVV